MLAALHHELLGVAGHGQHLPVLRVLGQLPQHLDFTLDMGRGKGGGNGEKKELDVEL